MSTSASDLRSRLEGLPPGERRRFRRRLGGTGKIADPERRRRVIETIARDLADLESRIQQRRAAVPSDLAYPPDLPITERRDDLLTAIRDHQVVIVAGETGSGKSTQLPKLCLELGRGVAGFIGHTQPRRIAARSIAERIAEETQTEVGGIVGYTVRFTDQVSDDTLIKVMTDGILLAEIRRDPLLERYDTVIVDEAHERSLNIDFLLGYLRRLLPDRPDLKVIITSATIDTERFAAHFDAAPVVEVSGRTWPVELRYRPLDDPEPRDQTQGICDAVAELAAEGPGDILVFCSGEREIRDAADAIDEMNLRDTETLQLFARLSAGEQHRVFQPHRGRRIVLATNVAETSLTVPGIRAVVDAGTARISRFSRRTKVQRLPIEPISQASADQRAGRCGRIGPGICIRLYTEEDYAGRPEFTEPEILRTNLASVILQMAAIGLGDIESFPFLDPPDARSIRDGIALLEELHAVEPGREGTDRWLTSTGRKLAQIPLDPRLGRMVLEADRTGCLREVLVITAALAIQDPRERPTGEEQHADQMHARFSDPTSDLLGWLELWEYLGAERRARTSNQFRRMCRDEFLNYRRVREWQDIHSQLREVADELGLVRNRRPSDPDTIHRTVLAGLLSHVGAKDPDGFEYRGARGARFSIAPGSVLFKKAPRWVMAADLVETTRLWARGVAPADPRQIEKVGAHLVRRSHSDPWWDAELGAAVAHETVTLYGLPLVTDRTVLYHRVDRTEARRLFIRHALVEGEWDTHHRFVLHNQDRIEEVRDLEARQRRADLLVDDDVIHDFFDARLPADITSVRAFDAWWKEARTDNPGLLDLTVADLIEPGAEGPDDAAFPEEWHHGNVTMPLVYEFDPASPSDGVTVEVPASGLERIDPAVFEWNVPGLREELVAALIRSLPKQIRKEFVPIPDTVREVLQRLDPEEGGLLGPLRRELSRIAGAPVPADAFDLDRLPAHLRPRFQVVGDDGVVLAEGDDLATLKVELREEAREAASSAGHAIERTGLTAWDFGELPRVVEIEGPEHAVRAFPALVDEEDSVAIRLMATRDEQADAMWDGTRRLLLLNLPSPGKLLRPLLTDQAKLALVAGPYEGPAEWMDDCLACALDRVLAEAGGPVWDGVGFDRLVARGRAGLHDAVTEVGTRSIDILLVLATVLARLDTVTAPVFREAVDDIELQLTRLVYPGFLSALGAGRLADIRRYLEAIDRRIDRLVENPDRDRELMERVVRLEEEHDRLLDSLPVTPELIEIAWMLQELRVSFFAQALGVRGTVSEKRIRRALESALTG